MGGQKPGQVIPDASGKFPVRQIKDLDAFSGPAGADALVRIGRVPPMISEEYSQMSDLAADRELTLLYEPSLIVSDSQRSYSLVRDAALQHLAPRDFVEQMLAAELVDGEWETLRLRRFKTMIVTSARLPALRNLLVVLLENSHSNDIDELAERFFTNKSVRNKVRKLLHSYGLTEASIDAEAFRQSIEDLAQINRRLAELALRRDKNLQLFEEHRAGLATPCASDPCEGNQGD
jgi:hypothetical protein